MDKIIKKIPVNKGDIVLFSIPYEKTVTFGKGASNGPKKIIECIKDHIEVYERFTKTAPAREHNIVCAPIPKVSQLPPEKMIAACTQKILELYKKKKFVITFGGGHTVSLAPLTALAKVANPKKTTILQIDAHFDLRDNSSDFQAQKTKIYHGSVMRRAYEMGYLLRPVGIRLIYDKELKFAKKNKIKFFSWPQSEDERTIRKIVSSIKTKDVYLTIDVDGLDPAFMPATGTPVQGGLGWYFTIGLLWELFKKKNVLGIDIVEVAPKKDDHRTEFGAAYLAYYMIALKYYWK